VKSIFNDAFSFLDVGCEATRGMSDNFFRTQLNAEAKLRWTQLVDRLVSNYSTCGLSDETAQW